jgi:hypothetical protein
VLHGGEIKISHAEIHHQAGIVSFRIAMRGQQRCQGAQVFDRLKAVEIVRTLSQSNSAAAELIVTFLIAHANASPIITLQNHQWTRECDRRFLLAREKFTGKSQQ